MKKEGRDWFLPYAEPYPTRFRTPEVGHVSPSPTVLLARRPDQRLRRPLPGRGPQPRLVQLRHDPGPVLLRQRRRLAAGRPARPEVRHRQAAPPRVVLRGRGQGRQGPPPARRPHLLLPPAALGPARLALPPGRPGPGRHDAGAALPRPGPQPAGP